MFDKKKKEILQNQGFILLNNVIEKKKIRLIKKEIISVMSQFNFNKRTHKKSKNKIDSLFENISKNKFLRSNVYKSISHLQSLYDLCSTPKIKKILKFLKFNSPRQLGTSIFAIEPNNENFLLLPHQDIRNNFSSKKAFNFWFPLSSGKNLGGIGIYPGSHKFGPLKHSISKDKKKVVIESKTLNKLNKPVFIENFKEGDVLIFSPYIAHFSIKNSGKKVRWTCAMCIDDPSDSPHFIKEFNPFKLGKYITNKTNEELRKNN